MTQRPQSPDGRPGPRPDSVRPPRTRRGGDLAPYPGARTRSPALGARSARATARPETASARSRRRTAPASTAPIPATVWTCGPESVDARAAWPVPIVETVTAAFTAPGAHIVLVGIATSAHPGGDGDTATGEAPLAAAREAVRALGRTAEVLVFDGRAQMPAASSSQPFWADLVTDDGDPSAALAGTSPVPASAGDRDGAAGAERATRADLVLASFPARAAEMVSLDRLALLAANRLRRGGIFAVYTHSDWSQGRLSDPTGAVVAAAQHADLLYLQHIVALHAPVEKGRLHAAPGAAAAAEYDRTRHRATVRGLPAPHLRAHGDVLAFAEPADPSTPPPEHGPAATATDAGGHQ